MFNEILQKIINKQSLLVEEAEKALTLIMEGKATPSQISSFITVLRFRGETEEELLGFTLAMRKKMKKVDYTHPNLVDTCGTGGDRASTFNISTAAAIVASSGGAKVAKHGNRAFSSKTGSADVLEELQIPVEQTINGAIEALRTKGMTFLFAPKYHEGMKHAALPRREIGFRTVFNVLGPMANPVQCKNQIIGVFSKNYARKMASVLQRLNSSHVLIVCGEDGLDEFTITGKTLVLEVIGDSINEYEIEPEDVGLQRKTIESIQVKSPYESAELIKNAFALKSSKAVVDVIAFNAGAALYTSKIAKSLTEGVDLAKQLINSGEALRHLNLLKMNGGHSDVRANY